LAAFRIELPKLLSTDQRAIAIAACARSLSKQLLESRATLGLTHQAGDASVVESVGPVSIHSNCHGGAIGLPRADREILADLGLDAVVLDSGCCGLAGAFVYNPSTRMSPRRSPASSGFHARGEENVAVGWFWTGSAASCRRGTTIRV
jgi:Fe-S oxidoreductase